VPHIALEDDIEYKIPFYMGAIFCSRHIMPDYLEYQGKKVRRYHGVKELAYLHPDYFTPSPEEPAKYGLRPEEYIFVRKVSGVSLNYRGEETLSLECLREIQRRTGLKILLSLEDKALAGQAARDFILLEEPVDDIHSLMAFARFTISSGDSMPREACVLGTPAIYTGGRDMKINHELIALGCLHKEDTPDLVLKRAEALAASDEKQKTSALVRDKIRNEWEDINLMLFRNIMDFEK
jgi:predicted glycosyltransferase